MCGEHCTSSKFIVLLIVWFIEAGIEAGAVEERISDKGSCRADSRRRVWASTKAIFDERREESDM